jgi:hypothetical protein
LFPISRFGQAKLLSDLPAIPPFMTNHMAIQKKAGQQLTGFAENTSNQQLEQE